MGITKLLHYGLQRSGTNYLENLLLSRYNVRFLDPNKERDVPTQKHVRLYDEKDIVPEPRYKNDLHFAHFRDFEYYLKPEDTPDFYLVISKDPYSWYLSYMSWAKKCGWPEVPHHYIEEYNLYYKKWLSFAAESDKVVMIRYIDLIADVDKEISRLEKRMNLSRRFSIRSLLGSKVDKVPQSEKFTEDKRNYYLHEEYLQKFSPVELKSLNARLDGDVVNGLGYEVREN